MAGNTGDDPSSKERMRVRKQDVSQNKIELENMDNKHAFQNDFAEDLSRPYSRSSPPGSLLNEPEKPHLKRALKARHVNIYIQCLSHLS